MHLVINTVELSNNIKLPYVEQGDRAGIPVLFLHGYTDSWRSFEKVLSYLPQTIRALAFTQRGHGEAGRPPEGYTPDDFADDAVAFMDALNLEAAVIVGHSMGSYIAQRVAMKYPERTLGVVLMGSFTTLQGNEGAGALGDEIATLVDPVDPDFMLAFQQSTLARPVPAGWLEMVVEESLKLPVWVLQAVWNGMMRADFSPEPGKIKAPTLLVWGDRDNFFPQSEQTVLLNHIPNARLLTYPGAGHSFHWEEPARFADDLIAFVQNLK